MFYMRNFFKIGFGIIAVYLLLCGIEVEILYSYEIEEGCAAWIAIFIFCILSLFLFIAIFKVASFRYKEIRNQSTLRHFVPSITREHVLERLEEFGFEIYSIGNIQLGLCMGDRNKFGMRFCYAFLLLGENMMISESSIKSVFKNPFAFSIIYENIINTKSEKENEELDKINNELIRIINNYSKDQVISFRPIICFWRNCLSDKAMEKCRRGVNILLHEIYIGYETFSENLYYAEAVEELGLANYNIKAELIREIFNF